jgi:hypothetical protein
MSSLLNRIRGGDEDESCSEAIAGGMWQGFNLGMLVGGGFIAWRFYKFGNVRMRYRSSVRKGGRMALGAGLSLGFIFMLGAVYQSCLGGIIEGGDDDE